VTASGVEQSDRSPTTAAGGVLLFLSHRYLGDVGRRPALRGWRGPEPASRPQRWSGRRSDTRLPRNGGRVALGPALPAKQGSDSGERSRRRRPAICAKEGAVASGTVISSTDLRSRIRMALSAAGEMHRTPAKDGSLRSANLRCRGGNPGRRAPARASRPSPDHRSDLPRIARGRATAPQRSFETRHPSANPTAGTHAPPSVRARRECGGLAGVFELLDVLDRG
jgi:hypothetical protein